MNIYKRIVLSTAVVFSLLFATSSFADDDNYEKSNKNSYHKNYKKDCNYKKGCKSKSKCGADEYKKYKKCGKKSGKYHKGSKSRFIIGSVYALDLSKEQENKIDGFMKEFQKKRSNSYDAFKDDSFDKQAYIDARIKRKENMIKAKADLIENIYSVLTKEQKQKLKKEIESFENRKK